MTCDIFKTYTTGVPTAVLSNDNRNFFIVYSEQWFDDWPRQLMDGGMTCQEARDYISAHWQTTGDGTPFNPVTPRLIVKANSTMAACAAFNLNDSTGGNFYAQDIELGAPVEVGGSSGGACTPSANYPVDGSWGSFFFESFVSSDSTWLPTVDIIGTVDINKWFCCRTDCCGSGLPPGGAPQFLIPGPDMPSPVEEKSSVPILNNPLYLANHTWAFKNNFGRLPK